MGRNAYDPPLDVSRDGLYGRPLFKLRSVVCSDRSAIAGARADGLAGCCGDCAGNLGFGLAGKADHEPLTHPDSWAALL